ncbi:MAG: glycosyltransferase, partial [Vulcanimicrobiaceae bacterium]
MFAQLAALFPEAPIYTALYDRARLGDLFPPARVHVSPLDRIPGAHRAFRLLAPLYPRAFEAFDLRAFDLVISSTTAWAKGIRFRSDAVHVSYLHTVSRFAYDYDAYVGGFGLGRLARPLVAPLVAWDRAAAQRPTALVASSRNAAARIARWYAREAQVVYPPVDLERFPVGSGGGPFVVVARLLPYKRVDLAIAACAALGLPLVVAGEGPARRSLERLARGTRTEFAGALDDASVARLLGTARAEIVAGEEDFGLVALEA